MTLPFDDIATAVKVLVGLTVFILPKVVIIKQVQLQASIPHAENPCNM